MLQRTFFLSVAFCAMLGVISCAEGTTDEESVASESTERAPAPDEPTAGSSPESEGPDPAADETAEATGGGTATLTFGDESFEFEIDECESAFGGFRATGSAETEDGPLHFSVTYSETFGVEGGVFSFGVELRKGPEEIVELWRSGVMWEGEDFEDPETDLDEQIEIEPGRLESTTLIHSWQAIDEGVPGDLVVVCD